MRTLLPPGATLLPCALPVLRYRESVAMSNRTLAGASSLAVGGHRYILLLTMGASSRGRARAAAAGRNGHPPVRALAQGSVTTVARNGAAAKASAPQVRRVAIYTRKSTEKGLEQEFNSLDAQREACELYARSQAHVRWKLLEEPYADGGFTGTNLERPAFQRLLGDIDAGRIDVVVVYKVDRLSRSLLDFARVIERFNRAGVAFVSVTQNFTTADAMGRHTLNMLMSFAEFEREMIGERTRDKMCAARRRGKWTGGPVPLGYRVEAKKLIVNELEANLVRDVFSLYLAKRSALAVARELNARHASTKRHTAANGNVHEGHPWKKGNVLRVLHNPIYGGFMGCGGALHPGEHQAIVAKDVFGRVRELLDENRRGRTDPVEQCASSARAE